MGKEFLPIFLDFNETTQDLDDAQCGRLIRALVDYANGNDYELEGMELMAFRFLKGSIDRNAKLSAIRAEAGSKGGKQTQANASKNKQTEANESKQKQNDINNNNDTNNTINNDKDIKESRFARFWSVYPRRVAKPNARKAFDKLNPDDGLLETMIRAIEQQKRSDQWTRDNGQYIPHPATWINQRRWEDETPVASQKPSRTVNAQDYDQRDYNEVQDNLIRQQNKRFAERLGRVG
jgi:hypothetical protein